MHQKDLSDIPRTWESLLIALGGEGMDIMRVSRRNSDGPLFHARANIDSIKVAPAAGDNPSVDLSMNRTIYFKEYKCVAEKYNKYVLGDELRANFKKCGFNSSYIFSMIDHIL